tara:strand:+ start:460 stop:717 length:258 start_codon:yes stop_codon:yes gene_type:complete
MKNVVQWYENSDGLSFPAIKILDCIFVMDDSEQIIHFHLEELKTKTVNSEKRYFLSGCAASKERARCQVIPPFINAFRVISRAKS